MPRENTSQKVAQRVGRDIIKRSVRTKLRRVAPEGTEAVAGPTFGFANVTFKDKKVYEVDESVFNDEPLPLIRADLWDAYKKYCSVLKISPGFTIDGLDDRHALYLIYQRLLKILRKVHPKIYLAVEYNRFAKMYHFEAYRFIGDGRRTILGFPLQFLSILKEQQSELYEPMIQFTSFLTATIGFTDWESGDNHYMDMIPEWMVEKSGEYESEDPEAAAALIDNATKYMDDGEATYYLHAIRSYKKLGNAFIKKLKSIFIPGPLLFCKQWMLEGMEILNHPDACNIMHYQMDSELDFDEDDGPYGVELNKTFIVTWNVDDDFTQEYLDYINVSSNEYGDYSPIEYLIIDKNVKKCYTPSDWFIKMFDWLKEGLIEMHQVCAEIKEKDGNKSE